MHAFNKELLYGVIHLQYQPDIFYSNGAKSCYDGIVHSVTSMGIQQLGMPAQPMRYMLGAL